MDRISEECGQGTTDLEDAFGRYGWNKGLKPLVFLKGRLGKRRLRRRI